MGKKEENGTVDKKEDKDPDFKERETWGNKFDFLLACIGFSVGLGNVWRFPYLCYKNGGGAFLVPYLICVIVGGIPLFYLEVAVGQFMGVAGINAWNICPFFRGIGLSTLIIVFFLNCYYNVILAWAFRYFFASFTSELPWTKCDYDDWATEHCTNFDDPSPDNRCKYDNNTLTGVMVNGTCLSNQTALNFFNITPYDPSTAPSYLVEPVTEYWENKVLAISDGVDEMGPAKWDLVLCLLFAWIVVYACICKGIRSSGKVMYVTATSPYIFMTVLLIRNCLLDGAGDGILYYVKPDFEKMKNTQVWVDAGTQIFFSYSISLGALTALGSYNKFHHNSYKDSIIFALANSGTSIFAGFIIFSILGHMAKIQDKDIGDVAEAGPGLAFIAYPKALTLLPAAPFWSVMFFLMVILLGLDSQFVGVEGVVTAIVDQFPQYLRRGHRREVFIGFVCVLQFLVGLPMVCPGGMYVFQLFDYYSGSRIILFVAAFMCVAVGWCYGVRRFYDNIEMMYGWRINPYMAIGWTVTSPIFCMTIFVLSTIDYSELDYSRPKGTYVYPQWAVGIGWAMAAFAAIWIPIGWIYHIIRYGKDWETFKLCFRPIGLQDHQMRPQDRGERNLESLTGDKPWIDKDFPEPKKGQPYHFTDQMNEKNETSRSDVAGRDNPGYEPTFTKL
ncbi:sodium- and chloride-dependent taurine transporter-like [Ruditapes philippinarum]|uniref:sodium- and chloride-dependent taurine transporter-like n=1 Tax=Ruditapes philippinarum TaxID=129788 RepID=UPI00295AFB90|nr:sodium- and chloride-dependent taurine transporter-like [Ruditapes philippinarum]